METQPSFDLNLAIRRWRENLRTMGFAILTLLLARKRFVAQKA